MRNITVVTSGLALAAGFVLPTAAAAADGEALARAKACMACHAVQEKVVGPSFADVARRYGAQAGQADGTRVLTTSIKDGTQGKWGPVPMPPNPGLSAAELATLVAWIGTLK